jgi:hypothetical protein
MTAPLRHVQFPCALVQQAGDVWSVHSDEGLFIITGDQERFVIQASNRVYEGCTGFRSADRDSSRRQS